MVFDVRLSMEHFYEIPLPFLNHLNTQLPSVMVRNESQQWPLQAKGHTLALIYSSSFCKETRQSLTSVKHSPCFVTSTSISTTLGATSPLNICCLGRRVDCSKTLGESWSRHRISTSSSVSNMSS